MDKDHHDSEAAQLGHDINQEAWRRSMPLLYPLLHLIDIVSYLFV